MISKEGQKLSKRMREINIELLPKKEQEEHIKMTTKGYHQELRKVAKGIWKLKWVK